MGIGNRSYLPAGWPGTVPHYPSWGSGTAATVARAPTSRISLPLMGIGNETINAASTRGNWSSFPLMGIGNPRATNYFRSQKFKLITPHGDRERETPSSKHGLTWLITPHGDRELAGIIHERRLLSDSLPLMGIGNAWEKATRTEYGELITPHGDREPRLQLQGGGVGLAAHYPSWGSGTHGKALARRIETSSLPLMGIGNATRWSQATTGLPPHYPSWGSGTRERVGVRPGPQAHYPSWGSGTRPF